MLTTEINDVLRCSLKFEHLVVSSRFESTGFQLVSNLDLLVVLSLIVEVVLKFDNEFNRLSEAVHDQFLSTERFDLRNL